MASRDLLSPNIQHAFMSLGKKNAQKSRKSRTESGEGVSAQGQLTRGSNGLNPGTKYKHSKNAFSESATSIALSLGHLGPRLLGLTAQSLIGSHGTLEGTGTGNNLFPVWSVVGTSRCR